MSYKGGSDEVEQDQAEIIKDIEKEVNDHKVLIYIKGTKEQPMCGFSAATIGLFKAIGHPFETVDILSHPNRRQFVPQYSNWPTFPQIYIKGEFIGGCDIMHELQEQGELKKIVDAAFE
ncbi:MAG: monothiol glutaredoxin [Candidatus Omnitrophota bacterium]|jgi:monothiol glutaredoxin